MPKLIEPKTLVIFALFLAITFGFFVIMTFSQGHACSYKGRCSAGSGKNNLLKLARAKRHVLPLLLLLSSMMTSSNVGATTPSGNGDSRVSY